MMNINGWKVIYNGIIYRPINVAPIFDESWLPVVYNRPSKMEMWVVDDRGLLIMLRDDADKFQFVKDLGNE